MKDWELLEKAAKAVNMDNRMRYCDHWGGMALYTPQKGYFGPVWNPLKSNSDAFRLAVVAGSIPGRCFQLVIDGGIYRTGVRHTDRGGKYDTVVEHTDDPLKATRRAIVLAVVDMGEPHNALA